MTIKKRIKIILDNQGKTIEELAVLLNWSSRALHNKLSRDSLKYYDVEAILNVLGYDLKWQKR